MIVASLSDGESLTYDLGKNQAYIVRSNGEIETVYDVYEVQVYVMVMEFTAPSLKRIMVRFDDVETCNKVLNKIKQFFDNGAKEINEEVLTF